MTHSHIFPTWTLTILWHSLERKNFVNACRKHLTADQWAKKSHHAKYCLTRSTCSKMCTKLFLYLLLNTAFTVSDLEWPGGVGTEDTTAVCTKWLKKPKHASLSYQPIEYLNLTPPSVKAIPFCQFHTCEKSHTVIRFEWHFVRVLNFLFFNHETLQTDFHLDLQNLISIFVNHSGMLQNFWSNYLYSTILQCVFVDM